MNPFRLAAAANQIGTSYLGRILFAASASQIGTSSAFGDHIVLAAAASRIGKSVNAFDLLHLQARLEHLQTSKTRCASQIGTSFALLLG